MEELKVITKKLDSFFQLSKFDHDPTMSKVVPLVYDSIGFPWQSFFQAKFVKQMNGLMIQGSESVSDVYLAVYPSAEVLAQFLRSAHEGDLLFLHHPIPLECGDPQGGQGNGFLPILPMTLEALKDARVSVFSLHAPLDTNKKISTGDAIVEALEGRVIDWFFEYGFGYAGRICTIHPVPFNKLLGKLKKIFGVPYVEDYGNKDVIIKTLGVIPGTLGSSRLMKMAEMRGADCYLTGEVLHKLETPFGVEERKKIRAYLETTRIAHVGVSHAASEYLVLKRNIYAWFSDNFSVRVHLIPEARWWR